MNDIKELITEEKIDGVKITKIGEDSNKIMLSVFESKNNESDNILALLAGICVPKGYLLINIYINDINSNIDLLKIYNYYKEKETINENVINKKYFFSKKKLRGREIYLFSYDKATSEILKIFNMRDIKRAYFISPRFSRSDIKNSKYKINTEIFYGKNDDLISNNDIKFLSKNIPSHVYYANINHYLKNEEELHELANFLTSKRNTNYTDYVSLSILAVIVIISSIFLSLFGYGRIGVVIGVLIGLIVVYIRKKI